jgi:hypothetical protein
MIEIVIRDFLKNNLKIDVFLEHQKKEPESFVIFEKTSSTKNNQLKATTFAFQSYGKTLYKACELNEKLKEVVEKLINLNEIASVKLNSDYNFTDEETKQYRYQAVFEIKHY